MPDDFGLVDVIFPDGSEGEAVLFGNGAAIAMEDIQVLADLRESDPETYEAVMRIVHRVIEARALRA